MFKVGQRGVAKPAGTPPEHRIATARNRLAGDAKIIEVLSCW